MLREVRCSGRGSTKQAHATGRPGHRQGNHLQERALGGYTIFGDRGSLRANSDGCHFIDDDGQQQLETYPQPERSEYAEELLAFATWVRSGEAGPTTGVSERRSLAIVQAGYESAASGEPIDLESRFDRL